MNTNSKTLNSISIYTKTILEFLIATIFIYTIVLKVTNVNGFKAKLIQSELVPNEFVTIIFFLSVIAEFLIAFFIFFNIKKKATLVASLALLIIYSLYLLTINEFSLFNGCSCGGIFDEITYSQHLMVNTSIILVNILIIRIFYSKKTQTQ